MLKGSDIVILNRIDASRLMAACGFTARDDAQTILSDIEDRLEGNERRFRCSPHDAAMAAIKLRDIIRGFEEYPASRQTDCED